MFDFVFVLTFTRESYAVFMFMLRAQLVTQLRCIIIHHQFHHFFHLKINHLFCENKENVAIQFAEAVTMNTTNQADKVELKICMLKFTFADVKLLIRFIAPEFNPC